MEQNLSINTLPGEIWKNFPNNSLYQVSSYGRIKSLTGDTPLILKQTLNHNNDLVIRIEHKSKVKNFSIHNLMAEVFNIPNNTPHRFVKHLDGNKLNNKLENLDYDNHWNEIAGYYLTSEESFTEIANSLSIEYNTLKTVLKKFNLPRKKYEKTSRFAQSLDGEIWKDINNFENFYQISNMGRVRSLDRLSGKNNKQFYGKIIKQFVGTSGYFFVNLKNNDKNNPKMVHCLIGIAFIPNPENKKTINHKDGNKLNNHVSNLEWMTHSENQLHAFANKLNNGPYSKNPRPVKCTS